MLSSVYLSGRLGKKVFDNLRMIELDGLSPNPQGEFEITEVPVRSNLGGESALMHAKDGLYVVIKGRLCCHGTVGLCVLSEIEEFVNG